MSMAVALMAQVGMPAGAGHLAEVATVVGAVVGREAEAWAAAEQEVAE